MGRATHVQDERRRYSRCTPSLRIRQEEGAARIVVGSNLRMRQRAMMPSLQCAIASDSADGRADLGEPPARAESAFPRPLDRKQTDSGQRTQPTNFTAHNLTMSLLARTPALRRQIVQSRAFVPSRGVHGYKVYIHPSNFHTLPLCSSFGVTYI